MKKAFTKKAITMIGTLAVSTALVLCAIPGARAAILAVSGDIVAVSLAGGLDVTLGATQSNVDILAFEEQSCFSLMNNLVTDQGVIFAGTDVECHFLHMDPVSNAVLDGKIRFDGIIIGVISDSALLDNAVECRNGLVMYPLAPPNNEPFRGLEGFQPSDRYQLLSNTELQVQMDVPLYFDQIRVITGCNQG